MSFSSDNAIQVNQLPLSIDFPEDLGELVKSLELIYKRIANCVNTKEGSLYSLQELGNFNQYFTTNNPQQFRNVYRKVFDMVNLNGGNIAGGATVNFAHNISGIQSATLIYASCTSTDNQYFTVVYPNTRLDATQVYFTNPLPATALSAVYVIAEYLKN